MRSAAVLACVNILCSDLASLPLRLFRRTPQGAVLAVDHPLFRLLHDSPNQWQTSMELRESMILDVQRWSRLFEQHWSSFKWKFCSWVQAAMASGRRLKYT